MVENPECALLSSSAIVLFLQVFSLTFAAICTEFSGRRNIEWPKALNDKVIHIKLLSPDVHRLYILAGYRRLLDYVFMRKFYLEVKSHRVCCCVCNSALVWRLDDSLSGFAMYCNCRCWVKGHSDVWWLMFRYFCALSQPRFNSTSLFPTTLPLEFRPSALAQLLLPDYYIPRFEISSLDTRVYGSFYLQLFRWGSWISRILSLI